VKKATYKGVGEFPKTSGLFERNFFKGFFSGQVEGPEVKKAWKSVIAMLTDEKQKVLPKKEFIAETFRQLPNQGSFIHTEGPTRGNCAVLMIDAGGLNCREREALSVLYQAVPNRFYSDLRSKQQTGYLVQSEASTIVSHHNVIYFIVQSSKYKPGDLFHRYNKFIAEMMEDLAKKDSKTLPATKFKMIVDSKLASYKTPNNNIASLASTMQTLLENYNADFRTLEKKQKLTEDLKYEEVLAVAKKVFSPDNKRRVAIGYTRKGDKLDKLPAEFVEFKPTMGKFAGKEQFHCPVKGMDSEEVKKKHDDALTLTKGGKNGKATSEGDMKGKLLESTKPKKTKKPEDLADVLPGMPKKQ
jgi:insulysin